VWDAQPGKELFTLRGHSLPVRQAVFAADGKTLATASGSEVLVWDAVEGRESRPFRGHTLPVRGVAFRSDGGQLATAGMDSTVKLWDPATGQVQHTFPQPQAVLLNFVGAVAFSPDGRHLAWGTSDRLGKFGVVIVGDTQTNKEAQALKGHAGGISAVAFSRDGSRLASGATDGTAKMWDPATGQELRTISIRPAVAPEKGAPPKPPGWVTAVAFSPDGKLLATGVGGRPGQSGEVKFWDATTGQEVRALPAHAAGVNSVAFSPDGTLLAVASGFARDVPGGLKVRDVATGEPLHSLEGHTGSVSGVAFSHDGRRLVSASLDGTVKLWDPAGGREMLALRGRLGDVYGVAFSPDGLRLAAASAGGVEVWDAEPADQQPRRGGRIQP
jgi:WD40 repeat protein